MSTPESSVPTPRWTLPKPIVVRKIDAALAQLESAIWIWFTKDDPISIRTLSEASHDCYHFLCKHRERPSILMDFLQTQSRGFQKKQAEIRNFLKHGRKELTRSVSLDSVYAEVQLFECVCCHVDLTEVVTPLCRLYATRFALEHRGILPPRVQKQWLTGIGRDKFGEIEIAKMSRIEFFQNFLPIAQQLPTKLPLT